MSAAMLTDSGNLDVSGTILSTLTIPTLDAEAVRSLNVDIRVGCDRHGQTFVANQYTAYPFRLSRTFRLDDGHDQRAYLYLMNAAPGLFGGDRLSLKLTVETNSHLYLTDQSATKVHKMAVVDSPESWASLSWQIMVAAEASLEFIPEPLILYADAQLHHSTTIILDPTSTLVLSEIIVPGRLARSEYYQFQVYHNRLRVISPDGTLMFGDTMRLVGQSNPLKDSFFFTKHPLMANIFVVVPRINLEQLSYSLTTHSQFESCQLLTGLSPLPNCNGLLIRVMGDRVDHIQAYIHAVLSQVRSLNNQPLLPFIPK